MKALNSLVALDLWPVTQVEFFQQFFKLIWIPDVFKTSCFCGSKDNVMQLMSELVWILEHQNLLLDRVAGEKRDKFFFLCEV